MFSDDSQIFVMSVDLYSCEYFDRVNHKYTVIVGKNDKEITTNSPAEISIQRGCCKIVCACTCLHGVELQVAQYKSWNLVTVGNTYT